MPINKPKNMPINPSATLALALCSYAISQPLIAAENDSWQFEAVPYLFAAGMDGRIGIGNVISDVDASFSDIAKNLDSGFMGLFTASKGPWTYGLEAVYMKLGDEGAKSVRGPFGKVTVDGALSITSKMYIYQGTVAYRIFDGPAEIDVLGALRYTKLESAATVTLDTDPGIFFPGGSKSASGSDGWADGVVGVRALYPLNPQWSLLGYGDLGGGGSNFTYQFLLGANWEFAKDFNAKVGYRQLYWDYEKDDITWDITASGPYLGLGIRF